MKGASVVDLNEAAVFARVVQDGSFTKAAASLGIPKSTVSRRVAERCITSYGVDPAQLRVVYNAIEPDRRDVARIPVGDRIVLVAFGAGFTSGAVTVEWTADPARGVAGDAAVRPEDVAVRLPVDWDSVDPIPDALAAVMAQPGPVDVPLDDVVPGEPEPAPAEVHA